MNQSLMRVFLLLLSLISINLAANDGGSWTERYDVEWNSPSGKVLDNMPFGAGDIGCNVWVEDGHLMLYIQRSGSFNEIGEYVKLGRVRLTLDPNPFINYRSFSQKLVLNDGYVAFRVTGADGKDVSINLWVDQFTHSVHLTIDAEEPVGYKTAYETWRYEDKDYTPSQADREDLRKSIHKTPVQLFGSFSFIAAPFDVIKLKDSYGFEQNKVLFYHRNPEDPLSPRAAIEQQGLTKYRDKLVNYNKHRTFGGMLFADNGVAAGEGSGRYLYTDFKSLILESREPAREHHIMVATHVSQEEDFAVWKSDLEGLCREAEISKGNFDRNVQWWNEFWQRSWIVIEPEKKDEDSKYWQMGRNYNLVRFLLGGNVNGEFPSKFNGFNVTFDYDDGFDPDWRAWGGDFFTAQNQRLVYWPLLKSGDFDAFKPQFDLYGKALNGARIRCREYFGHDGAVFGENTDATGLQLPFLYGWFEENNRYRRIDLEFGDPAIRKFDKDKGITWVEHGICNNQAMAFHYSCQLEFAYMMLEYHSYSGESIEPWYDFIRESLVFYDEHYQKRKTMRDGTPLTPDGKLDIYPSQGLENYRIARNPADPVSGLYACLESLIEADFVPKADKKYYRGLLERVPPLPFGEIDGHRVMRAAQEYDGGGRKEMPQFYPLFPYNLYSLEDDEIQAFRNTWKYDDRLRKDCVWSWFQNGIFLARMGLLEECIDFQFRKLGDNEEGRRFPVYWGPGFERVIPDGDWGTSGIIGLQEMLMQNIGGRIYILPCWDKKVDVDYKLHAPQQTTVEVSLRNGKIEKLEVIPASREKDIILPSWH